ncbi:MAG TPA: MarR family winged helix-turn-helix transcriptional regulator [Luteibacter sp.]|jgi:DNA-binding MarR family transcriptional regulator|nr:MarR family winged helix-turn-helix transcriptional regulator [Luteibacter sp.]
MDPNLPMRHCNAFTLRRAARAITQLYERHIALSGLTSSQFSIISAVRHAPGMSMAELAETMGMDRTTLVRALKPLQRDRLVVTVAALKGSRQLALNLSAEGMARYEGALPYWMAAQKEFEARVGTDRARKLREELLEIGSLS